MEQIPEESLNRRKRKKICYWFFAILCFCAAATALTGYVGKKKTRSPDLVILGDSLFTQTEQQASVGERLQSRSGLTVFGGTFGGTCMARRNVRKIMGYDQDVLSMAVLARAVASEDFAAQQSVRNTGVADEYFEETVDGLDQVDFDDVKILLLVFGMNDYHSGIPVEDTDDPRRETTYAGALRTVLELLQKRYPDLRIILVTPTYSWYPHQGITCEVFNPGGGILEDYVEKEMEIAREYGVEILDLYHDLYAHDSADDWKTYTRDGVHPNEAAMEMIASVIADYLEENP